MNSTLVAVDKSLTVFSGAVATTNDFGMVEITFSELQSHENEADAVGSVEAFVSGEVSTETNSDTTPPTVDTFNPVDGGVDVAVTHNIVVEFSESILNGAGIIAIFRDSADCMVVENYDAATSTNLAVSGAVLTINPTSNLSYSTHYYMTFSEGSVKDLAGNSYAGFASYDFTTEAPPPMTAMVRNGLPVTPDRYTGLATSAGGVPIHFQFIGDSNDEVLMGTQYNDFINSTAGVDAADAKEGNDVIDGGAGSNFLTGGAGTDIFFSDGRGAGTTWGTTWSTITDWQAGEQLSVWGWHPGTSRIVEWTQAGAAGYEGLTMHADLNGDGTIDTSVTFTGIMSPSQLPTPLEFDGLLWFV